MAKIAYFTQDIEQELHEALRVLAEEYPLVEERGGDVHVRFRASGQDGHGYAIRREGNEFVVEYAGLPGALRAVGTLLGLGSEAGESAERTEFRTFGIMLDCSRNAVMKVSHFKGWLRKLALLGYNMAMLYTEDTYKVEGEPYFGYQRGAYTAEELREMDAYARRLGIEMIACIQTLGHLAQVLKWDAYADIRDTEGILLVGEDKTYELLDKIMRHWTDVFTTRRIHVGMDEAHELGRGRYLDRFGYRDGFTIFNEHLKRVVEICGKHGLKPMIWSDMYFRLGSKTGTYYDTSAVIPDEIKAKIPKEAELVYWDYYHDDDKFYRDFIEMHRALGFEPIMGSGVWTWHALWHGANYTEAKAGACVRACQEAGLKEIFFTMWGDDGALCDYDSAMQGLAYVAELAYGGEIDESRIASRFAAVCHGDYQASRLAGELDFFDAPEDRARGTDLPVWAWPVLWDDPLLGLFWTSKKTPERDVWGLAVERFRDLADRLRPWAENPGDRAAGDLRHIALLAEILARKAAMRYDLEKAYATRDKEGLARIAKQVPGLVTLLRQLDGSYREQWLRRNKPFGLEVPQIRIAGLIRRFEELAARIGALVAGKIDRIDELDDVPEKPVGVRPKYRTLATACHPGP